MKLSKTSFLRNCISRWNVGYSLFLLRSNSFNLKEYSYTSPNSFTSDFDSGFTSSNNSVRVLKYGSFA